VQIIVAVNTYNVQFIVAVNAVMQETRRNLEGE
jgi:hypothetical protein